MAFLPLIVALASAAAAAAPASPVTPVVASGSFTLRQVMDVVRRDNPEIIAARKRWESSLQRPVQAGTPGKPRLDFERMYAPAGNNVILNPDEKAVSLTQELPFPTTLLRRRRVAIKEAGMAEQDYRAVGISALSRARAAYAGLFLAERSLAAFDESVAIMRRFSKVAESKLAAGRTGQSDALKAQVELTRMLNMQVATEAERDAARAMLNALMGREAGAPLGLALQPPAPSLTRTLDEAQSTALSGSPEVRRAALDSERAAEALSLARSEVLPDLMLQYRRRSDPVRGKTNDAILGLSLPLWFWSEKARIQEASAAKEAAEAGWAASRLGTAADVRDSWARAKAAQRLVEAYSTTLLPQAEESLKVAESAYQADRLGFLDLLDAQRSLLNTQLESYRYVLEYEDRLADLERAVGQEL